MSHLRARYMNPALGGFLSLDPFEGYLDVPMSLNGYEYVHGNPVNLTDASGEDPISIAIGISIVAVGTILAYLVLRDALENFVMWANSGCCTGGVLNPQPENDRSPEEELAEQIVEEAGRAVQRISDIFANSQSQTEVRSDTAERADDDDDDNDSCPFPTHPNVVVRQNPELPVVNFAQEIKVVHRNLDMCINRSFYPPSDLYSPHGEVDIELEHIIIEAKLLRSQWKGLSKEIERQIPNLQKPEVNYNSKPIIYFIPKVFINDEKQKWFRSQGVRQAFGKKREVYNGRDENNHPMSKTIGATRQEFIAMIPLLNTP